jgi:hypothetical protein
MDACDCAAMGLSRGPFPGGNGERVREKRNLLSFGADAFGRGGRDDHASSQCAARPDLRASSSRTRSIAV